MRFWLRRARLTSRSAVNRRRLLSASSELRPAARRWSFSVKRTKSAHPDAGREHRDAVDERPGPRALLAGAVGEERGRQQPGADAVAEDGEQDVPEEQHPVLVERDEADRDEEVEVRLDGAVGEHHQRGRAGGQPGGDGERRPAGGRAAPGSAAASRPARRSPRRSRRTGSRGRGRRPAAPAGGRRAPTGGRCAGPSRLRRSECCREAGSRGTRPPGASSGPGAGDDRLRSGAAHDAGTTRSTATQRAGLYS